MHAFGNSLLLALQGAAHSGTDRFLQPPQLVWLAMNVLLTLLSPPAMSALLCEAWPQLVDTLLAGCARPGQHSWMVLGCLRSLLHVAHKQVWTCFHMHGVTACCVPVLLCVCAAVCLCCCGLVLVGLCRCVSELVCVCGLAEAGRSSHREFSCPFRVTSGI